MSTVTKQVVEHRDHPLLDLPVSEQTIFELHAAGLLTDAARDQALSMLMPAHHWWRWANRALLFVGAALVLSGIVFFFAHNWARMPAVAKFGILEMGLWTCAVGALRKGLDNLSGKVLLLCACMFVGVLLAVYGQVYQTGADAYENYVLWVILILPWVVLGKFGALWVSWLAIANVALILFWHQAELPDLGFEFGLLPLLAALNSLALAGYEYGARRPWEWLEGRWIRWLVGLSILIYLTLPTCWFIVEPDFRNGSFVGLLGLAGALPLGFWFYRHRAPDLACLAFVTMSGCVVALTMIGKVLFEISDEAPVFLLFGMIVLVVSSAAALFLRRLGKDMGHAQSA